MAITEVKTLINQFSINEQLQLAMYILENVSKETEQEVWLTETVEKELMKRKAEAIEKPHTSISYEEVMADIRNRKN